MLVYLLIAVPVVWITELFLLDMRVKARDRLNITNVCPIDFYAINNIETQCSHGSGALGADDQRKFVIDSSEVVNMRISIVDMVDNRTT